ncbi:MAG: GIY-YIG nuclease family protein [Candidatus Pacebacteria bacterium]|nr:GIY-YIG nuclease family protein [Candidatus Paceibacterota bacterium]
MNQKHCYVYIVTNKRNTVLYTGITNDLNRRMYEHKNKLIKGFTSKYNIEKLIYFQEFNTAIEAITAEKKIKGWTRKKKMELIKSGNFEFKDLSSF